MDIEKIKRLVEFDTPTVSNGLGRLKYRDPSAGYTGPDVRALMPDMGRRVGVAVTARLDTTTPGVQEPASLFDDWIRLMVEAGAGGLPVFAVIEAVGLRPRYVVTIGDGMATIMRMAGAVAFVTNGSIRDWEGVRDVGLPCWGAGLSPMHGVMRWLDVNSPVVIDGMTVCPGDILHADVNGVLSIPAEIADRVYDQALAVRQFEQEYFARLRRPGVSIQDYLAGKF